MTKNQQSRTGTSFVKGVFFLLILGLIGTVGIAQERYTLSGKVTDRLNGETLFGASVYLKGTNLGVITNEYGFYSLTAPAGKYTLIISYIGYEEESREIDLNAPKQLNFELKELSNQLDEVLIEAGEPERALLKKPEMSVAKLNIKTVKQMPVVLGEVDIIKSLQLLPGVTSNGEGSSGFHVRGGAADQNLVLLDEAIIYNTSHMLGFFSVFNADAIKDIKLYKGGIPARFGGRVSSVLDVRQKDGNNKDFGLTGGVGIISSRLAVEGPMFNENGSFLVAGRTSYAHLLLKASGEKNSISFYDLNLKSNYQLNDKNRLYVSGYFGRDLFNFDGSFKIGYGNMSGNLRWNHLFSDKLFSNLSMIYSKYDYELGFALEQFNWQSSINNYHVKYDLKYYLNDKIKLDFGLSGIYYDFDPGRIVPTSETSEVNAMTLDQKKGFESALYVNAEHTLSDALTVQYGLRYSGFNRFGGQPMMTYANDQPVVYNSTLGIYERGEELGETPYDKDETIASFGNVEPRLALAYQFSETSSVKMGFSRAAQYVHLLSSTASVTPLDVWTPSGKYIKPQLSNQYSLGYFKNFKDQIFSLEIEGYYKRVANRIDYIDGANLIGQNTIETEILNGKTRAYGLEFLLRKNEGKFTGWLAYTISKAEQQTPGGKAGGPGINDGNWYNTPYDRTHDISLTGAYQLSEKWSLGASFAFQTGRPVTYPNGQFSYEGLAIANYDDRNANRLPAYHRFDISATWKPNRKPTKRWKGEWVFGIYNLYGRKNAASISFGQNLDTGENEATRTSIFGIVPSFSYNFKF
ncbi:TonB-dependent receptor [Flavobacteriaceae bacterium F08102]|nr:TonB-dependent receptor [Flavobacteriaceae bacterium F08102]